MGTVISVSKARWEESKRRLQSEVFFPVAVKTSYCTKITKTVVQKTAHGVIRREVQFNLDDLQMPAVHAFLPEFDAFVEGTASIQYSTDSHIGVLVTRVWKETIKSLVGQRIAVLKTNVKELNS